ncbi:MAG: cysteine synthase family protein [Acidobacteriota bacterium]|nr:MAG: cysteine synthase family protein [Acidobacteriota bacterium]
MADKDGKKTLGANTTLRRFGDIRELIAGPDNPTPIVKIGRVIPQGGFELHLKLEWFNPFGSIKDRPALYLLKGMEERGELEGKKLVEPTSGNTGIALAALAALMKKKFTATIPEGEPEEKKVLLRMLGAEVWPTPDDLCPTDHPKDGAIALAHSFVKGEAHKGQYAMPNQYENPDNVKAHYETTGPEIWNQTEGAVRYFFAGLGTCGTITGVGRYLKEKNPDIEVIAVEPQQGHRVSGLKNLEESKEPGIFDRSVVDQVVRVDDDPAYAMTKRLFREEGLIVGPSTGAIVHAAAEYGKNREGVAVAVSPDSGLKYSSFFVDFLGEEGKPKA